MILFLLIVFGFFYLIYRVSTKEEVLTYIDKNGNKKVFNPNFTVEDLEEVYEELAKIPMED